MAYANDKDLIKQVQSSASALGVAAQWASGKPVKVANDFLYEMYLLFKAVEALMANYDVKYIPGVGKKIHAFPRNPAPKAGWPKFHVMEAATNTLIVQICAGTKARDINGHERGIDLSIQKGNASDDPNAADVLQIFDAKYRSKHAGRITHHEFSEFTRWIELFMLRGAATPGLNWGLLAELDGNCLITNGQFSTELSTECTRVTLREIERFYPTTVCKHRP